MPQNKRSVILLFISLLALSSTKAQQSSIIGVISIHNSEFESGKKKYVASAEVSDPEKRAQHTYTDINGKFELTYIGVKTGQSVSFKVYAKGLEVVNIDDLDAVTGSNLISITMAPLGKIAAFRTEIYQIGKLNAQKELEKSIIKKNSQIKELKKNAVQNKILIAKLENEIEKLTQNFELVEQQANELADKYASINLDDATPLLRKAFILFQSGKIDSSILILSKEEINNGINNLIVEKRKVQNALTEFHRRDSLVQKRTTEYTEVLLFKARLFRSIFQIDSALATYRLLLQLAREDYDLNFEYAYFLKKMHMTSASSIVLEHCWTLCNDNEHRARTANILGIVYGELDSIRKSEHFYRVALGITDSSEIPILRTLDVRVKLNLANFFIKVGKLDSAELFLTRTITGFKYVGGDSSEAKLILAKSFANLANAKSINKDFPAARQLYTTAIELMTSFKYLTNDEQTSAYLILLNDFSTSLIEQRNFQFAEEVLKEEHSLLTLLYKSAPRLYRGRLIHFYMTFGLLKSFIPDYSTSQNLYKNALEIIKEGNKHGEVFSHDEGRLYYNLSVNYLKLRKIDSAEYYSKKCVQLRKVFAQEGDEPHLSEYARALELLADIYLGKGVRSLYEVYYKAAKQIFAELHDKFPNKKNTDYLRNINSKLSLLNIR